MRRVFLILFVLSAAVSCVYPYEVPELVNPEAFLVVDGSIVVGKEASITLSWMNQEGNNRYSRVLPEEWWVEDDSGTRYLPEKGQQKLDLSHAPEGRSYRMVVLNEGKTYSSPYQKGIEKPVIESIDFNADETTVSCDVSLHESGSGTGYIALSFEERWRFHTEYEDTYYLKEVTPGQWVVLERVEPDTTRYWCWRYSSSGSETLVDVSNLGGTARDYRVNSFARTGERCHGDYTIKVHARSISEAEYRFRRNLDYNSAGYNLFTPNPGEIAGNVICEEDPSVRVMGYVTLSLYSSKEACLDGRFYKNKMPGIEGFEVPRSDQYMYYYYDMNFRPICPDPSSDAFDIPILWGPLRCIDCVADGGSLEKPSFK